MDKVTDFANNVRANVDRTIDRARQAWQDTSGPSTRAGSGSNRSTKRRGRRPRRSTNRRNRPANALGGGPAGGGPHRQQPQGRLQSGQQWAKDHKDLLIEIAAIGVGVLAGLACGAITLGVGAVACMVGAGALINLAKDAAQGNIKNWGDAFSSMGTGAVTGLLGAFGGFVGAKVAGALASKIGARSSAG